jgi:hypothetical protein
MANERPEVVGQEPVEADVAEAQLPVAALELGPPNPRAAPWGAWSLPTVCSQK